MEKLETYVEDNIVYLLPITKIETILTKEQYKANVYEVKE